MLSQVFYILHLHIFSLNQVKYWFHSVNWDLTTKQKVHVYATVKDDALLLLEQWHLLARPQNKY